MFRWLLWTVVVAQTVFMPGCGGPWRDAYFRRGVDRLTQDQVTEKFGPPHTAKTPALGGDTTWTYRFPMSYKEVHPWDPSNIARDAEAIRQQVPDPQGKKEGPKETLYCYRYTLVFKETKVLKSWKREDCVPGVNEGIDASR